MSDVKKYNCCYVEYTIGEDNPNFDPTCACVSSGDYDELEAEVADLWQFFREVKSHESASYWMESPIKELEEKYKDIR